MNIKKLNEQMKTALNEMAVIADIEKPVCILVYNTDHEPPHFHIARINTSGIRVKIPNRPFKNTLELINCVLPEDKELIPAYSKYFKAVVEILQGKSSRKTMKDKTNLELTQFLWETYYNTCDWEIL